MSTRNNNPPIGIALLFLAAFSVVLGIMANELLGYLQQTNSAPAELSWWVPALGFGIPVAVIGGIVLYLYLLSR